MTARKIAAKTDDLVGSRGAADILGVTVPTITRYVADEILTPVTKLGGKNGAFVFNRADVEQVAKALSAVEGTAVDLVAASKARGLLNATARQFTGMLAAGQISPVGKLANGVLMFKLADVERVAIDLAAGEAS